MQDLIKNLPDIPYIGFRSFIIAPFGALGFILVIVLMGSVFQAGSIIEQIGTEDWVIDEQDKARPASPSVFK